MSRAPSLTNHQGVRWRERSRIVWAWRLWATRNPVTFRDKVRYKMLRDHRDLVVTFADKAAVRDYVTERVGPGVLPQVYALVDDPEDLQDAAVPNSFVLKPTHGSGAAIIVSPHAPAEARLPADGSWVYRHVRPEHAPPEELVRISADWIAQLYGQGPNREWVYGRVSRRALVEEFLAGPGGDIPPDLKFFVFHGQCRFIQVDGGRFGRRTQDFFTREWDHLALSGGPPWADPAPQRPGRLEEMVRLAETLGDETDFVRVDLYDMPATDVEDGRIVFGELTSFPAGGDSPFDPESFNREFGRTWTVPRRYR